MTSDQDQLVQWSDTLADAVEHASRWTVTVAARGRIAATGIMASAEGLVVTPLASTTREQWAVPEAPSSDTKPTPLVFPSLVWISTTRWPSRTSTPLARLLSRRIWSSWGRDTWKEEGYWLLVSLKYQLHGVESFPQTMVAPYLGRKPAFSIAGMTPNSSNTGMLAGSKDSPTWWRGNRSLSSKRTLTPFLASIVAVVLPAGPPPMTMTSGFWSG